MGVGLGVVVSSIGTRPHEMVPSTGVGLGGVGPPIDVGLGVVVSSIGTRPHVVVPPTAVGSDEVVPKVGVDLGGRTP